MTHDKMVLKALTLKNQKSAPRMVTNKTLYQEPFLLAGELKLLVLRYVLPRLEGSF